MSVFLRKQNLKKGVYLSFIEAFYDPKTKNTIQKTIEKIGYVEELKKTYNDPIKYFSDKAKELSIVSSKKYEESKEERIPRKKAKKPIYSKKFAPLLILEANFFNFYHLNYLFY